MNTTNNKISIRQAMIMYVVAAMSPITRVFPLVGAKNAGHAAWISAALASATVLILAKTFSVFFKKGDGGPANLSDVYALAFGKAVSKAVLVLYAAWVAVLFLVYIRFFAEKMLATMFTTANIGFFVVIMMGLVYIATRSRLEAFARFSEVSLLIFGVIITVLVLCLLPVFKAKNILPITPADARPVLQSSYRMMSILGYFTLFFFLGDHISDKESTLRRGSRAALHIGVVSTVITAICIGTLSYRVVERMPMPFFSTTKLITIMQPLDRMEAFLLCTWVIADFIIITAFAFILMNIVKKLFNAREARHFATPVAFFGLVGGLFLVTSRFELEAFSRSLTVMSINVALGFGVPILALVTGRLRGRL